MATYLNSFYKENLKEGSKYINTDSIPVEYKRHLIYRRNLNVFDIVKNDICIGVYAGINGAKGRIDQLILNKK